MSKRMVIRYEIGDIVRSYRSGTEYKITAVKNNGRVIYYECSRCSDGASVDMLQDSLYK